MKIIPLTLHPHCAAISDQVSGVKFRNEIIFCFISIDKRCRSMIAIIDRFEFGFGFEFEFESRSIRSSFCALKI